MRSTRFILAVAALAACQPGAEVGSPPSAPDAAALPAAAVPLPQTLTMTMSQLEQGQPIDILITGAVPGRRIYVLRAQGPDIYLIPDAGPSIARLGGANLDFFVDTSIPRNQVEMLVSKPANAQGEVRIRGVMPANAPLRDWLFQAVDTVDDVGSNALARTVQPLGAACLAAEDSYEPNEDIASATNIFGGTGTLSLPGLQLCPGSTGPDVYEISLIAGNSYDFTVAWTDVDDDIDVAFLDGTGATLAGGFNGGPGPETFNVGALVNATYYLSVEYWSDGAIPGTDYDLDIVATAPTCQYTDPNEPNNDEASATPLVLTSPATPYPSALCPLDIDWYELTLAAGDTVSGDITFLDPIDNDLDGQIFDDQGNSLSDAFGFTSPDPFDTFQAPYSGSYYAVIAFWSDASDDGSDYTLTLSATPAPACTDDGLEDNDDQATATPFTPGTPITLLTSCPGDFDYFEVPVLSGDLVSATVSNIGPDAADSMFVQVLDDQGNILRTGNTSTLSSSATNVQVGYTGFAYVRAVTGLDDPTTAGISYDVAVNVVTPPPCLPDANEPNDTLATATPITPGNPAITAYGCGTADSDVYSFTANAGDVITASVAYPGSSVGDADMELLDDQGNRLSFANLNFTTPDPLSPNNVAAPYTGTYYLRVFNETVAGPNPGFDHSVNLAVLSASCQTDAFEPNDTIAAAAPFPAGPTSVSTYACDADDDWYAVSAASGDAIQVTAAWPSASFSGGFDIDMQITDATGVVLAATTLSSTTPDSVTFTVQTTDVYYVRLWVDRNSAAPLQGTPVDLTIDVITPPPCVDDLDEPNDDAASASPFAGFFQPAEFYQLCPNSDDFFELALVSGDVFAVGYFSPVPPDGENVQIDLVDDTGLRITGDTTQGTADGISHLTASYTGSHYVRMFMASPSAVSPGEPYELSWILYPPGTNPCPVDVGEPNEDAATATPFALGTQLTGLGGCTSDFVDVYSFNAAAGDIIDAWAFFSNIDDDLDLYLYGPGSTPGRNGGTSMDSGFLVRDFLSNNGGGFSFTATTSGTHYVAVDAWGTGVDTSAPTDNGALYNLYINVR